MTKITDLIKSLLLAGILLIATNCATSDLEDSQYGQSPRQAKDWYDNHKDEYNATILNYIQKLEWENAIISDGVDGEVIEIPFTLKNQLQSSNEKASLNNDRHRLVFIKDDKQKFKIYYVQIFTDNLNAHNLDEDYSYYGMTQNFNGKVFVSDLQTNKTNVIQFKDGQTIQQSLTSKWREETYDCTFIGYWGEGGNFHPIKLLYCEGGGFDDGDPYPQYGGGGSGGSSGGTTPAAIADKIEKRIISDNLKPCQKEILEKLKTATNSDIAKMLTKLGATTSYSVTFFAENPQNMTPAASKRVSQYNYKIQISNDYESATKLFRAGNMLPELGHVFL